MLGEEEEDGVEEGVSDGEAEGLEEGDADIEGEGEGLGLGTSPPLNAAKASSTMFSSAVDVKIAQGNPLEAPGNMSGR